MHLIDKESKRIKHKTLTAGIFNAGAVAR